MRKNTKRSAVIAGVATVIIGGGVAAWATVAGWDIAGSGDASAKGAKIIPMTAKSTIEDSLYPGRTVPMTTTVKNPNEFPVNLDGTVAITNVTVTPTDSAGNDGTCASAIQNQGVLTSDFPGTPKIEANATAQEVDSSVTVGQIPPACAGKNIKITYSFAGKSTVTP